MLTRKQITDTLADKAPYLASEYGVKSIGLFGSYAKGTPTEASDVDVVVEFARPIGLRFIKFTEYLEELLGKRVDVLTNAGIQGIRVAHVAEDIQKNIVYVESNG